MHDSNFTKYSNTVSSFLVLALKKTEFWPLLVGYGRLLTTSFHSLSSLVEVRSEEWLQSRYSVYRCNCFQMWKT